MGISNYPLTQEEFDSIYSKVPRLTVEIIVQSEKGVLLTLRTIEPCAGKWHIPGGTVYYGELLADTVKRIAEKELSIKVKSSKQIGIIEYPDHVASGYGDPRGLVFLVLDYEGQIETDSEASGFEWFKQLPENLHPNQDTFLLDEGFLKV
jgi:ADP-ribose pyrophosphatase YjhB (NUDIX family)